MCSPTNGCPSRRAGGCGPCWPGWWLPLRTGPEEAAPGGGREGEDGAGGVLAVPHNHPRHPYRDLDAVAAARAAVAALAPGHGSSITLPGRRTSASIL